MKNEYAQWRKLDNAALAFPAVTGKNDTRVFRFYCELKEEIKEENLQEALERTLEKYPLFRAVLRKGLFWFYLERRDIPAVVKKEAGAPCSGLYIPDKKTLLFRVSYYKNRINFEVFHALTDGTGAMHFLMELVKNYLQETHPSAELPELFPVPFRRKEVCLLDPGEHLMQDFRLCMGALFRGLPKPGHDVTDVEVCCITHTAGVCSIPRKTFPECRAFIYVISPCTHTQPPFLQLKCPERPKTKRMPWHPYALISH